MNTRRILFGSVGVMVGIWAVTILTWRDAPFALTFDDAWYYFTIARNVANGSGSTFDGISATNGYHPLWLLMCVPVFALGLDGMAAARTLLVMQLAIWGAAMLIVADIASRFIASWPRLNSDDSRSVRLCTMTVVGAFVLLAGNPFMVKVFVNGLESGVAVLAYAALLAISSTRGHNWISDTTSRWRLGVGALLAVGFLARTDVVIAIGALGLWTIAAAWPLRADKLRALVELFGPAAVTIGVYMAFNQARFGTAMQISGVVKRAEPSPEMFIGLALAVGIAALVGVTTFRRSTRPPQRTISRFARTTTLAANAGWFASFCVLIIGYYSFMQVQQWLWYYAPVVVLLILLATVGVADFVESSVIEAPEDRPATRALAPVMAILLAPLLAAFLYQSRSFSDPDLRSIQIANRTAGDWIRSNLPEGAVLASWDAGVVGYFSHRSVINLDGVVNSIEFHRAQTSGTTGAFLTDRDLGWIVNHGSPVDGQDPDIIRFVHDTFGPEVAQNTSLVESWPFTFSGNTVGSDTAGANEAGTMAVFLYRLPSPPAPPLPG